MAIAGRGPRVQRFGAAKADWVILSAKALADLPEAAAAIRGGGGARVAWSAYLAYDDAERRRALRHFAYMALDAPPEIRRQVGLDELRSARVRRAMLAGRLDEAAEHLPGVAAGVVRRHRHTDRVRCSDRRPPSFVRPLPAAHERRGHVRGAHRSRSGNPRASGHLGALGTRSHTPTIIYRAATLATSPAGCRSPRHLGVADVTVLVAKDARSRGVDRRNANRVAHPHSSSR